MQGIYNFSLRNIPQTQACCVFPSLTVHEDDDVDYQSRGQLNSHISKKLTILRKLQQEHQSRVNTKDGEKNEKVGKYRKKIIGI